MGLIKIWCGGFTLDYADCLTIGHLLYSTQNQSTSQLRLGCLYIVVWNLNCSHSALCKGLFVLIF